MARNLYWTEVDRSGHRSKGGKIMVSTEDGRYRRSLINTGN